MTTEPMTTEPMTPPIAHASVVIAAPRARVWRVLMNPATILRISPADEVVRPWGAAGEPFRWRMRLQHVPVHVDGTVLRVEAERLLEYDFIDPHTLHTRDVEEHHRVLFELTDVDDDDGGTRVSLAQDNNGTDAALKHAEGGWRLALHNLKALVEGA